MIITGQCRISGRKLQEWARVLEPPGVLVIDPAPSDTEGFQPTLFKRRKDYYRFRCLVHPRSASHSTLR